jgi:putative membrane protein
MAVIKLFLHIVSATLGFYIAAKLVPGVDFFGSYFMLVVVGVIMGLANFFIKPILKAVSLPIRILTLGLFSLIINMALVWLVADVVFSDVIEISGLLPLFWTTLIIWFLSLLLGIYKRK